LLPDFVNQPLQHGGKVAVMVIGSAFDPAPLQNPIQEITTEHGSRRDPSVQPLGNCRLGCENALKKHH
jgi:hypothetical protein